jgi:hypothetical protein
MAQTTWGIFAGGIGSMTKTVEVPENPFLQTNEYKPHIGVQMGAFYRGKLVGAFDIELRTAFQMKGFRYINNPIENTIKNVNLNYLNISPTIGYTLANKFRFGTGVSTGFLLDRKNNPSYARREFSLLAQVSYISSRWSCTLGYTHAMNPFYNNELLGMQLERYNRSFFLSLDIPLSLGKK